MPRKRRTPQSIEEAALHASASAAMPPVPRPAPQEPVLQAREDTPSGGGRGPQGGGGPPGSGEQQGFGPGPQQGGRSGGGGSGLRDYQGGFPSSGQPPEAYPLSGPGEQYPNLSLASHRAPSYAPRQTVHPASTVQSASVGSQPAAGSSSVTGVQGRPPLETFGELSISALIEDVAVEEQGLSSPVRQTPPVSSRARSTRAPGGGSVPPLPPLKENIKKVMFYC